MAENNVEIEKFTSDGTSGLSIDVTNYVGNDNFRGANEPKPFEEEPMGHFAEDIINPPPTYFEMTAQNEHTSVSVSGHFGNDHLIGGRGEDAGSPSVEGEITRDIDIVHYDDGLL